MRTAIASLLALASLPLFAPTVYAGKPAPKKPCIYVTSFFYKAPLCPVVLTGETAPVQELLSSAQVVNPSTIGVCQTVNTSPALSYQFFVEGNGANCKYTTYTQAGCKGTATVNSLANDQFKCLPAPTLPGEKAAILPLPTGVVSYKVTCGSS